MGHLLIYQLAPLAVLWALFHALGRRQSAARWGAAVLLAAGAALQLAWWWAHGASAEGPDSAGFLRLARGDEQDLRALLYRPKLYPLFLGLFPSTGAAALAQCLLKSATGWLVWRLARSLGCGPGASLLALALFLGNALWLDEPLRILDTTLFTFLFTACLWLGAEAFRRWTPARWLALCAAAGLAALTRQVADLSLALVTGMVLASAMTRAAGDFPRRRRLALGAAGLALLAAIAGAGAAANGLRHGAWTRSVALGVNVYTHSSHFELADPASPEWAFVESRLPGARDSAGTWNPRWREPLSWQANALPHRLERALGSGSLEEIRAADAALADRFLRWAGGNPGRYAASAWNEAMRLLWKCEEYYPAPLAPAAPPALLRLERGFRHQAPGLLLLLALAGAAALPRDSRRSAWRALAAAGAGLGAYLLIIPALQIGFTRYALPALPALFALAALAAEALSARLAGLPAPPGAGLSARGPGPVAATPPG